MAPNPNIYRRVCCCEQKDASEVLLLDTYTGATAAYSVVDIAGNGDPLLECQRSSDDAKEDMYDNGAGGLETSAGDDVETFVGAGNGGVSVLYDLSRNGNHLLSNASSVANMPKIVRSGTMDSQGGVPAIYFFSSQSLMRGNPVSAAPTGMPGGDSLRTGLLVAGPGDEELRFGCRGGAAGEFWSFFIDVFNDRDHAIDYNNHIKGKTFTEQEYEIGVDRSLMLATEAGGGQTGSGLRMWRNGDELTPLVDILGSTVAFDTSWNNISLNLDAHTDKHHYFQMGVIWDLDYTSQEAQLQDDVNDLVSVYVPDTTPPNYLSSAIGLSADDTVEVTFAEDVNSPSLGYDAGVTIKVNGGAATISSATRQVDQSVVHYVIGSTPNQGDTVTWEYSIASGDIEDQANIPNAMGDVSAKSVTNYIGTAGPFVSTWKTNNAGTSNDDQITLPLINAGDSDYDFNVDWGDGSDDDITAYNDAAVTHTYASAGTYTVTITGTIKGWRFINGGDKDKITEISRWGPLAFTANEGEQFWGCSNLDITATDAPDTSSLTTMSAMFGDCTSLSSVDLSQWSTSSVTTMRFMFDGCNIATLDLSSFDVSSVTNMERMFSGNSFLSSLNLSGWSTSLVASMKRMFRNCSSLSSVSADDFNVTSTTTMSDMFLGVTLDTAKYDEILISYEGQAVQNSVPFHGGNSTYTSGGAAEAARTSLINDHSWTITDGGAT